jgi:peptidoglycan/LPS O-acetylase OafA/YrhL
LRDLGIQAVDVFFVLSGFVIAFVTDNRERDAMTYSVNRLARIGSVAIPALALTFCLDWLGKSVRPELYAGWGQHDYSVAWQYVSGLLFVNELWFWDVPQGSNLPYWSLGFEVWYYIIFGLAFFAPRRWKLPAAGAAMLIAGPRIVALFPLWLMGLGCYHLITNTVRRPVLGRTLFVVSAVALLCYELSAGRHGRLAWLAPAFMGHPEFVQDYLVGSLFTLNLIGFANFAPPGLLDRPARTIRWLAGRTFSLYLYHYPIMHFLAAEVALPVRDWRMRTLIVVGTLVGCFALAEVTECRKEWWRRRFAASLRLLMPAPATS